MTPQESLNEVAKLRYRFQKNSRLRLESLAALSKVFREFGEPLDEELLSTIVFAVPDELPGESAWLHVPDHLKATGMWAQRQPTSTVDPPPPPPTPRPKPPPKKPKQPKRPKAS